MIGMCTIVILYMLFIVRMISMAKEAKDFYGTLIIGVTSMFAYQIIQNIGMRRKKINF